jgi:hypothetical protein
MSEPPDLTGATVMQVKPGDSLVFVVKDRLISAAVAHELLDHLRRAFPANDVRVVHGVDEVVVVETQPEWP